MFEVCHATKPTFGCRPQPVWPSEYVLVARVSTDTPDGAFRLTNHIDSPWWYNGGVEQVGQPSRSTSVGDVVKNMATGELWHCDNVGWSKLWRRLL